ncbi:MAG: hypothetical protein ACRD5F_12090 [Candidatus Acidiferrales bacterium]
MRYAIGATALLAAAALGGATGTHAQGQSQSQGQYQSVAPKKKPGKPVDPADVATLTGRPVPQSALAKSQANANAAEENGNGTTAEVKRPPVNPADVDILTGRNDRDAARDYRWQPQGWEALWAADWMGERGYRDESFLFVPGAFGRNARPFFFRHRFGHGFRRPFVRPLHFGRGAFFFFVQ